MKTRITELLGIKYPIIGAAMANVSYPPLVAAISNAGGLGILSGQMFEPKEMRNAIRQVKELTDKPFGVNFVAHFPSAPEVQAALIEEEVAVASYGRGDPKQIVDKTQPYGIINMPTIGAVKHATSAEGYGVHAVILQGMEAGGHASFVSSMVLLPQVVDAIKLPVVAAGGFCDARGLVAALALGAEGIAMGTRFILTKESPVPDNIKRRYLEASEEDTAVTPYGTGVRCRALQNKLIDILEEKRELPPTQPYMTIALEKGDGDLGFMPAGQVVGRIHDVPTCEEVIERIVSGAEEILGRIETRIRASASAPGGGDGAVVT